MNILSKKENKCEEFILSVAAQGDTDMIEGLFDSSIDFDNSFGPLDTTILINACLFNTEKVVKHLLKMNIDINKAVRGGVNPLKSAILANSISKVQLLLEEGVLIDDGNGISAISYSVKVNNFDIFNLLIEHGGRVDDTSAITPLGLAVAHENYPFINKLMYENNCDINKKVNAIEDTPLHIASSKSLKLNKFLLSNNAYIDAQNIFDRTPLIHSVMQNKMENAQVLIKHGADIHLKDHKGKKAVQYALKNSAVKKIFMK